jgi:hypothetical protein
MGRELVRTDGLLIARLDNYWQLAGVNSTPPDDIGLGSAFG